MKKGSWFGGRREKFGGLNKFFNFVKLSSGSGVDGGLVNNSWGSNNFSNFVKLNYSTGRGMDEKRGKEGNFSDLRLSAGRGAGVDEE